jgi:hypothetical protein
MCRFLLAVIDHVQPVYVPLHVVVEGKYTTGHLVVEGNAVEGKRSGATAWFVVLVRRLKCMYLRTIGSLCLCLCANRSLCPFVHPNEKARRLDPRVYSYEPLPCPFDKKVSLQAAVVAGELV